MRNIVMLLLAVLLSDSSVAEEANKAIELYQQSCAACHGSSAEGNAALGGPALAGQQATYLIRQLTNFSNGARGGEQDDAFGKQMVPMAKLVADDASRQQLAEYLQSLPLSATFTTAGDVENGYKYYQGSCGACHGGRAEGNESLNSPRLTGLHPDYLRRQYQKFLIGQRGTHADDKLGRQMAMMAATMTDPKKVQDVIAYIASLPSE